MSASNHPTCFVCEALQTKHAELTAAAEQARVAVAQAEAQVRAAHDGYARLVAAAEEMLAQHIHLESCAAEARPGAPCDCGRTALHTALADVAASEQAVFRPLAEALRPEALRYCLPHELPGPWRDLLEAADEVWEAWGQGALLGSKVMDLREAAKRVRGAP